MKKKPKTSFTTPRGNAFSLVLRTAVWLALLGALWTGTPAGFAQNTVFTYQGDVQVNGTNFTGIGEFQFALVVSSNANQTATAVASAPDNGFITTITVTSGGNGYLTAPAVEILGGGGSNATATATISNGMVVAVQVNIGGNGAGYTNAPEVVIAPPPAVLSYTTYWSNDGTSEAGSEPAASVALPVTNGFFTVLLGNASIPNMSPISAALFNQAGLELQIWFNDGSHGFAALAPVQAVTASPYAAFAVNASNLVGTLPATQLSGSLAVGVLPTNAVFSGTLTADNFSGSGTNLTSLNAGSLAYGTVPLAQLSGITSNQLDALTWMLATNLNGGDASLASNLVSGITLSNLTLTGSVLAGNGNGLTNLNASQLSSIGNTNPLAAGNFFVGTAGNATMVGYNNTAIGLHALQANTNGLDNTASGLDALAANTNGSSNTADGAYALENNGVGSGNTAVGENSLAGNLGGTYNTACGQNALKTATNGSDNTACGTFALQNDIGGSGNTAIGYNALVAATGSNNIAVGFQAGQTISSGSSNIDIGNPGLASDTNVIRIGTSQSDTYLVGTVYANTMSLTSDRNAKSHFVPVNPLAVLAGVSALPISTWHYKSDPDNLTHLGPMAQDFHAAFGLDGGDDRHISVVDATGVALAAIQGLDQKLAAQTRRLEEENDGLREQNARLEKRLAELEKRCAATLGSPP